MAARKPWLSRTTKMHPGGAEFFLGSEIHRTVFGNILGLPPRFSVSSASLRYSPGTFNGMDAAWSFSGFGAWDLGLGPRPAFVIRLLFQRSTWPPSTLG